MPQQFEVGGVSLKRPFKIRRLGHFGLNLAKFDACLSFLIDDLGFVVSDHGDLGDLAPGNYQGVKDTKFYFLRYGTDHHAIVLASVGAAERTQGAFGPFHSDVTLNQATWQVGSLREVVDSVSWLEAQCVNVVRSGRDMPGSNWHTYFSDPDGRVNELFWGMEQVGWNGLSKPPVLHRFGRAERAPLPQPAECDEVDSIRGTAEMWTGHIGRPSGEPRFEVDGMLMRRPFKVVALGPLKLFCKDMTAAAHFYQRVLGFELTATRDIDGERCLFLRAGHDHHNVVLVPFRLRTSFGLEGRDNLCSVGLRVANYRQLRDARAYFADKGYREVNLPAHLSPGVAHCFHIRDPDGRLFQLYSSMEQIGWDGQERPMEIAVHPTNQWPETIPERSDLYGGEPFLGPWE